MIWIIYIYLPFFNTVDIGISDILDSDNFAQKIYAPSVITISNIYVYIYNYIYILDCISCHLYCQLHLAYYFTLYLSYTSII